MMTLQGKLRMQAAEAPGAGDRAWSAAALAAAVSATGSAAAPAALAAALAGPDAAS